MEFMKKESGLISSDRGAQLFLSVCMPVFVLNLEH